MSKGTIHVARLQHFPKKLTFLTPDTHTHVCVSKGGGGEGGEGVRNVSFFENSADTKK